jgi:hypothetical protein
MHTSEVLRDVRKVGEVGMRELIIAVPDHFGKTLESEKVTAMIQGKLVRCRDCRKAELLTDKVVCRNQRNTECQMYPLDWFCADGERKEGM